MASQGANHDDGHVEQVSCNRTCEVLKFIIDISKNVLLLLRKERKVNRVFGAVFGCFHGSLLLNYSCSSTFYHYICITTELA